MPRNKLLSPKIVCACCNAGSTITSLGCMAIMTATIVTTGTVAVGSMGAMATSSANNFSFTLLNSVGLGFLIKINLRTLEFILITLLLIGIISTYLSYRYHRKPSPLMLSAISSILIYISIFVIMSNSLYYISLLGLVAAAILNFNARQNGNRK